MITLRSLIPAVALGCLSLVLAAPAQAAGVEFKGKTGPGQGKRVVLVSGDEEYRSEETLVQLAKILAEHHGFDCKVLFAIDKNDGTINPNQTDNIPGLEALRDADLMILFTRFRNLPDEQMRHVVEYVEAGKPIIGLRTATHAFNPAPESKYADYGWTSKKWDGGFGRQVLGETWINHHGKHGRESTRGIAAPGQQSHPILRGIQDGDIWGPTDVYGVRLPLPGDSLPLVLGQVLVGMKPNDAPLEGEKNNPMMPIAWTKTYESASGKKGRVFTTTMGASQDFASEGLRRLLVNATYWALGLEDQIPEKSNVEIVGDYLPSPFRHNGFKKGVKPEDLAE
jgi:type 1 glutamine amidotransferase